jgi:hypothetical protein
MDHRADMGVAIIMDIGAGGIEEGSAQRIDTLGASDDRHLFAAGKLGERAQRDLDRRGAAARQRHREEIHERALRLMPHGRRNVLPASLGHIVGKALRRA